MPPKKDVKSPTESKGKKGGAQGGTDFNQPVIVNNSKSTFTERLEKAKEEHRGEIDAMLMEMERAKKENERLRRQQEDTFGITIDTVQRMKQELERAKTTRMFLLEDINIRKEKCERMEAEIFELNMKLESYTKKLNDFRRQKLEWEETSEKLAKTEERCERLTKANKNMKALLVKHHIDPKSEMETAKRIGSQKQQKTAGGNGSSKTPRHQAKMTPTHSFTHVSKKASRSLEDLSSLKESHDQDDVNRKYALTNRKPVGQGAPAYLGFYTNIHQNRLQIRNKLAGANASTQLPKIHAV